jgi:hypothetical protein
VGENTYYVYTFSKASSSLLHHPLTGQGKGNRRIFSLHTKSHSRRHHRPGL